MTRRKLTWFFLSGLLVLVSGCATYPIADTLRQEANRDLTLSMVLENPTAYVGSIVIWGGRIIQTINHPHGTEIIVLETPLSSTGMPVHEQLSQGRFIARASRYLDPEIYRRGRRIILAGEIVGKETRPLGETEYTYPVVSVRESHLVERERRIYPPPYYWDWGWYYPYGWPYGL